MRRIPVKIRSEGAFRESPGRAVVVIEYSDGTTEPLPHLVKHSPDGFAWGYGGSGPSDLARSIVGWVLSTKDPHPRVYQAVKAELVAGADQNKPFLVGMVAVRTAVDRATRGPA